ncbi:MAG: hypothetical protein JNL30_15600 [Rubrivivax sp.]|nr:hypothetical protein [Rubrivivax sp.]
MMKPVIALSTLALLPALVSAQGQAAPAAVARPKPPALEKRTVAATPMSPEYVQLARNVEIIPSIESAVQTSGVATHEGVFGPLLFAERTRAFFLELKPGMFVHEHPHDLGSLVYTVRGKWVLASEGKRQVMEAGSLFRFGDRMPTGWEAPFAAGALLLIVKYKPKAETYASFHKGLEEVQAELEKEHKSGVPFYFDELKPDHPAVVFARSVNPDFDAVLKARRN